MSKRIDLVGQKFGRLTVTEYSHTKNGIAYWKCLCDCGNVAIVAGGGLKSGNTKSCGCFKKEQLRERSFKHGKSRSRLYFAWHNMIVRCYSPNSINFNNYGGRGITVCDEWKNNCTAFCNWAKDNGYSDNLTLDRIDVNGNYCPENCRWITRKEQGYNRTDNHFLTFHGRTMTMSEWSEETGLPYYCIKHRINSSGWDVKRTLTTPVKLRKKGK